MINLCCKMNLLTWINRRGISAAWIYVNLKLFTTFIYLNRRLNIYTRRCMRIVQYYRCSQVVSYHIELVVFLVVVAFAICHVHRNVHLIFCFPSSFSMLSSSSSRRRRLNFLYYFCVHRIIIEFYTELCVLWFSPKKERNDFFGQIPACHKQQKREKGTNMVKFIDF